MMLIQLIIKKVGIARMHKNVEIVVFFSINFDKHFFSVFMSHLIKKQTDAKED